MYVIKSLGVIWIVMVNGEMVFLFFVMLVSDLLVLWGLMGKCVVVECNGEIVL